MTNHSANNKRIARNTIILYIRMLVVMGVTLFTSRIVLQALGVEDFGLYNVVGGVVGLFTFLRTSMEKCTQRFLNVEMAKKNGRLNEIFCMSMSIHITIMIFALLLAETVGLWFLNSAINIPDGREFAANIVYQSTLFSLCCTILSVPYSACVISHEKMSFYALISVLDAFMKLAIAYMARNSSADNLIIYGILMACISFVEFLMYVFYCKKEFIEAKYRIFFDKTLFKDMLGFAGWNLVGQATVLGVNQGNSILVNIFHSVTANAAMTVGNQVNNAVVALSANFQTAFNPQITKSYASNDISYMRSLLYGTSKLSFLLLIIITLPIFFNIDFILSLWLKTVPTYSSIFCILSLCCGIINALSTPLNFCIMATGDIKWSQIMTALVYLSDIVVLYALFSLGLPPATAMSVKIAVVSLVLLVRLYYVHKAIPEFDIKDYTAHVILPLGLFSIICLLMGFILYSTESRNLISDIFSAFVLFFISITCAYYIVLNKLERNTINEQIKKIIKLKKK